MCSNNMLIEFLQTLVFSKKSDTDLWGLAGLAFAPFTDAEVGLFGPLDRVVIRDEPMVF